MTAPRPENVSREPTASSVDGSGRLLLCNIGRIGDTILRNSIITAAQKSYGRINYICGKGNREIVSADPRLNHVHVHDLSPKGLWGLLKTTLLDSYDCHIDLKDHDSSISLIIATLTRARLKIGCNRKKFRAFHRDSTPAYAPGKRKLDVVRDIAAIAGLKPGGLELDVPCSKESEEWFSREHGNAGRFYFVNISATDPARMWGTESWIRLLKLFDEPGNPVFISGVPEHAGQVRTIANQLQHGIAFKPRCLMDVIAAIRKTKMMLSVDTGLIQVAAAFNKPLLGLYSSSVVHSEFAPSGGDCITLVAEDNRSLTSLDPVNVIKVVKEAGILQRS